MSSHVPCFCLGSINLRRPPIWDMKHVQHKNRVFQELSSESNVNQPRAYVPPAPPLTKTATEQPPKSSLESRFPLDRPVNFSSSTPRVSSQFHDEATENLCPKTNADILSQTKTNESTWRDLGIVRILSRYSCLGGISLRRPPIWDMKHLHPTPTHALSPTRENAIVTSPLLQKQTSGDIFEAWRPSPIPSNSTIQERLDLTSKQTPSSANHKTPYENFRNSEELNSERQELEPLHSLKRKLFLSPEAALVNKKAKILENGRCGEHFAIKEVKKVKEVFRGREKIPPKRNGFLQHVYTSVFTDSKSQVQEAMWTPPRRPA